MGLRPGAPGSAPRRRSFPMLSVATRSWVLTLGMVGVSLSLLRADLDGDFGALRGWLALTALALVAETLMFHVEMGGEAHSFSLGEIPLVVGIMLFTPIQT